MSSFFEHPYFKRPYFMHPSLFFSACFGGERHSPRVRQDSFLDSETDASVPSGVGLPFWTDASPGQPGEDSVFIDGLDYTSKSTIALMQVFKDPELLKRFTAYAEHRYAAEGVLFLQNYFHMPEAGEERDEHCRTLMSQYLDENADNQVNLASELVRKSKSKSISLDGERLLDLIQEAAIAVFNDLKINPLFTSFIKDERKALIASFYDYLRCGPKNEVLALSNNRDYDKLINFLVSVKKFEDAKTGDDKKALALKIRSSYLEQGACLEIPSQFIEKFDIDLFKKDQAVALEKVCTDIMHYLLTFEDIVKKARAWQEEQVSISLCLVPSMGMN